MTDLPDLFAGFDHFSIDVPAAPDRLTIAGRRGGEGSPLLLLHGYPQTHVCWHRIAPQLARHHTVVAMDLRGYGASTALPGGPAHGDPQHLHYSKRALASDAVHVMRELGFDRFGVAGHDRGGRVAYRLALDHPQAVTRLIVLDIFPTIEVWDDMDWNSAIGSYHWPFLAQPAPLPETLISASPEYYVEHTLASWTKTKDLSCFAPGALAHYRAALRDPARVAAVCEDYRAGATFDRELDFADRSAGRRITCPTFAMWGNDYVGKGVRSPLAVWQNWCVDVDGHPLDAGHFLAEETPEATAVGIIGFLGA